MMALPSNLYAGTKTGRQDGRFPHGILSAARGQTLQGSSSRNRVRIDDGLEESCQSEEDDDLSIRIGNGRTGETISLSYFQRIPKKKDGSRCSYGSQGHPDKCTPCCFVIRTRGCADGALCTMCHESHPEASYAQRKRKQYRVMKQARTAKESTASNSIKPKELVKSSFVIPFQDMVLFVYIKNTFLDVDLSPSSQGRGSVRTQSAPP